MLFDKSILLCFFLHPKCNIFTIFCFAINRFWIKRPRDRLASVMTLNCIIDKISDAYSQSDNNKTKMKFGIIQ